MAVGKFFKAMLLAALVAGAMLAARSAGLVEGKRETAALAESSLKIEDPMLLEGWMYLNSLEDQIALWDGQRVSGKDLAQFVRASGIPVAWGSDDICSGSSCSRLFCDADGKCAYEDGQPGIDPIYINAGAQDQQTGQVARVAAELAHEAFHRMRPFGNGTITQLEEYWAFYAGAQITHTSWPKFDGVDPLDGDQLAHWFHMHMLRGYLKLEAYPQGMGKSIGGTVQEEIILVSGANEAMQR